MQCADFTADCVFGFMCPDIDSDVHTGTAGIAYAGMYLYNVSDKDRVNESHTAYINRYAILAAPVYGTGVGGLVDPLHYGAAMYFSSEIYICRFAQEPERYVMLFPYLNLLKQDSIFRGTGCCGIK